jgi:hypothetical protein
MTLSALSCCLTVLVAGCSATIPGIPLGPGGGGSSRTGIATHAPIATGNSSAEEGNSGDGGDPGSSQDGEDDTGEGGTAENAATCQALQNLWAGFSEVQMDQAGITQEQVDGLFQGSDQASADVQPDLKTLHDAAEQAAGKPASDADAILTADQVNKSLMDVQLDYLASVQC